jgi:catechol 2,3-dioxygenase-like lactoylglutathione lyase family enzyme
VSAVTVRRVYTCLCVDDPGQSIAFYRSLLDLEVIVDVDWYVEMASSGEASVMLAFVQRGHPSVPAGFDVTRGGVLVSVTVADASRSFSRARDVRAIIAQELRDEEFGQRHFMVVDPDGFLVDVIEPIRPSVAFRRQLVEGRRRGR